MATEEYLPLSPPVEFPRTRAVVAAEIAEEKRLHDRWPVHFEDKRAIHMELIYHLIDELNALPVDADA
jgi:hypothetical protein